MTTQRQAEEQFQQSVTSCMAEQGYHIVFEPDGSSGGDTEGMSDAQFTAFFTTMEECSAPLVDEFTEPDRDAWGATYDKALETKACLEAYGYTITDPPSREAWIEAALNTTSGAQVRAPWESIIDEFTEADSDEYFDLFTACPQPGPIIVASF